MAKVTQELETLRKKDAKTLKTELTESQAKLQKARVDFAFGRMKSPAAINQLRKQIARIQTILKQQEASHA